jgi:cysteine-rich repeat protein
MVRVNLPINVVFAALLPFACAVGEGPDGDFGGSMTMPVAPTTTTTPTMTTTTMGTTGDPGESTADAEGTADGGTTMAPTSVGESDTGATEVAEGGCPDGGLGCPCLPLDACNVGLMCDGEVCVVEMAVCGDGMLGGAEECDDGAGNGDDKLCKADCTDQVCGDGKLGPGEACDDGNAVDADACSNACVPAACGDMVVQAPEVCDDANVDSTDECVNCNAAACGDTFVQVGVEGCDDGNVIDGDGCSAVCAIEPPKCGGTFSTDWCPQNGTNQQFTRCESVANGGKTCNNPQIRYGVVEGGIPANHGGNDYQAWCTQLGFAGFSGQVSLGVRACDAPMGRLFGYTGYDEPGWHWCDWQDGTWLNQSLDNHGCNMGDEIVSITCL